MPTVQNMTSVEQVKMDEKALLRKERIEFILYYVDWIKRTPNKEWSRQQAEFIDACFSSKSDPMITPEQYLKIKQKKEQ